MIRAWVIAMALLCASCGGSGPRVDQFAQPLAEVRARLLQVEAPAYIFGTNPVKIERVAKGHDQVDWVIELEDQEVLRFVAQLAAGEGGTNVTLDVIGPAAGSFGNVEERLKSRPEIRNLYLANMREAIAAHMEGRPFDQSRTFKELGAAMVLNVSEINAQFDKEIAQHNKESRAAFERAYSEPESR